MSSKEQALLLLADEMPQGRAFFEVAARALAVGAGCRWAGVCKLRDDGVSVRQLALWGDGGPGEPFTCRLRGSPCQELYRVDPAGAYCFFPRAEQFPECPVGVRIGARSYRGEVFHDADGHPVGHVFAISDREARDDPAIRDLFRLVVRRVGAEYRRLRAEEMLRWYENMLSTTSDSMAFVDTRYVYRAANQPYVDLVNPVRGDGLTRGSIVGRTVGEVLGEEFFRTDAKPRLDRCLAGSEVSVQRWFGAHGPRRRYLNVRYQPCRAAGGGSILGAVVMVRDSTRQRRDQRLLVELVTHEALVAGDLAAAGRLIAEAVANRLAVERVGIWLLNDDSRELRCQELFERSKEAHSAGAVLLADDYPRYFEALIRGRAIDAHDARVDPRTREFTEGYLVPLGITSMLDATIRLAGEVIGVVCHEHVGEQRIWQADEMTFAAEAADLVAQTLANHDRLRLERRLHEAQKMESLGVLAGGVAHDFNNLLVGILGGAELALSGLEAESHSRRHVELVREAALRASDLCSQMLAYSGKGKFLLETVDLSTVVEGTAHLVSASLRKDAVLSYQLAGDLPATEVDVTQVRQIVMNLLTNAADALPEEGGEVTLATGCEVFRRENLAPELPGTNLAPGPYVFLEVTDTGRGMDEAIRGRIFEPFYTTKFAGRGLGLAAVLGIVRSHGGAIDVDSVPRRGTRIRVYFPAVEGVARPAEEPVAPTVHPPATGTVLLVDDEELVRQVARDMLEASGFEVLSAGDGREAVELVERHGEGIDAVILDLTMPRMSGEAAFDEIRRRRAELPILLASGYTEEETLKRFAGKGVAAFVHKPFRAESFVEAVQGAMATRVPQKTPEAA